MAVYPRNFWYIAAMSDEIGSTPFARKICDQRIVFYRKPDGQPVALQDYCPHRGLPLSKGKCEGRSIRCGYHGMLVNEYGECESMPQQPNVGRLAGIHCYPCKDNCGYIWVWVGDESGVDESSLPNMPWKNSNSISTSNSNPQWTFAGGVFHLNCDYRLLVDNLMDLSHETYVHPESIGQTEIDEAKPDVAFDGDNVIVERWMNNITPPPFWAGLYGSNEAVDRWQICRFYPPSNVHIDVGVAKAGSGAQSGNRSLGISGMVVGFITPESATSCWYFWGMARDFDVDDEALTERIYDGQKKIFYQDVGILEAQQENILQNPDRRLANLDIDSGGNHSRRIIEKLCSSE